MRRMILAVVLLLYTPFAVAQKKTTVIAPATPEPRDKAVWEPVNYGADVELNDVFFVTDQEGWVTGAKNVRTGGVLLHTSDGGDHWDLQAGDPDSSENPYSHLRFLDSTHGWAVQSGLTDEKLLHTSDGTTWMAVGNLPSSFADYQFTSDSVGVVVKRDAISITHDGGRTWSVAFQCAVKVEVNGLAHDTRCDFVRVQFLTTQTGYAIGNSGGDSLGLVFLARTDDGGETWRLTTAPASGEPADAFFIDENTGYVQTGRVDSGLLFKTTDAGATWKGLAGSPGQRIAFADPDVGWAVDNHKVSFTHDGGTRWNSREYPFPSNAWVRAFSLPRRDRGYVVGTHGLIYRYRVVPAGYSAKGLIPAAALTPIDFTVPDQLQQLSAQTKALQASATAAAGTATSPNGAAAPPPATQQLENTLDAVVAQTPAFVSRYRNLNLLMVGLQMVSGLPQQIAELKQSFALAKSGADPDARAAAVADFSTKLQGVITFMNANFHSPLLAKKKGVL